VAISLVLRFGFVARLMCFCLCLFDTIINFHDVDENVFNDFFIGK
jgi:hypothetical protein